MNNELPDCVHRGRVVGQHCFCRHNCIRGEAKSVSVHQSQCGTCQLRTLTNGDCDRFPARSGFKLRLGDKVEAALKAVGVTKERVSKWLGRPCNCDERKQKLNQLSEWAQNATKEGLRKLIGE